MTWLTPPYGSRSRDQRWWWLVLNTAAPFMVTSFLRLVRNYHKHCQQNYYNKALSLLITAMVFGGDNNMTYQYWSGDREWVTAVVQEREIVISLARIYTVVAYVAYGNKDEALWWRANHGGADLWLVVIERDGSGFTFSSRLDHIPTTPITTTMALLQWWKRTLIWWEKVDGEENGSGMVESPLTAHSFRFFRRRLIINN